MNFKRVFSVGIILLFVVFITISLRFPSVVSHGATEGLIICSKIIIPSLFPITVCVIYIFSQKYVIKIFNVISKLLKSLIKIDGLELLIFTSSFLGGYPVGAVMINDLHDKGAITKNDANTALCSAVNAGPAFIISAVGSGVFQNRDFGLILFATSFLSSFTLFALSRFIKSKTIGNRKQVLTNGTQFTEAVSKASTSVLSICGYVVLFSTVCKMVSFLFKQCEFILMLLPFLEVTNGIVNANGNIYITAFLIGFGGISVHLQILSLVKSIKPNLTLFFLSRLLHGTLNVIYIKLILKITGYALPTISNGVSYSSAMFNVSIPHAISLVILSIAFLFVFIDKNNGGKRYPYVLK